MALPTMGQGQYWLTIRTSPIALAKQFFLDRGMQMYQAKSLVPKVSNDDVHLLFDPSFPSFVSRPVRLRCWYNIP